MSVKQSVVGKGGGGGATIFFRREYALKIILIREKNLATLANKTIVC